MEVLYPKKTRPIQEEALKLEKIYYHHGDKPVRFIGEHNNQYWFQYLDDPEIEGFATSNLEQIEEVA